MRVTVGVVRDERIRVADALARRRDTSPRAGTETRAGVAPSSAELADASCLAARRRRCSADVDFIISLDGYGAAEGGGLVGHGESGYLEWLEQRRTGPSDPDGLDDLSPVGPRRVGRTGGRAGAMPGRRPRSEPLAWANTAVTRMR